LQKANNMATSISEDPKKKGGTPPDPHKPSALETKYGPFIRGRESDVNILSKVPNFSDDKQTTYRDRFAKAAQQYGFRPELLFASAAEEGFRDLVNKGTWSGRTDYPVAGFESLGLDNFSSDYPQLVAQGLLPADFKNQFTTFSTKNEKDQSVQSADFKNIDSAIMAKAAEMASRRTTVDEEAKKQGITLTPEARDFFTLVAYNATAKTVPQMMSDYNKAGYLQDNAFLKARPTVGKNGVRLNEKSYADVYDHIQRRMVPAEAWKSYFSDAGTAAQPAKAATLPDQFKATVNGKEVDVMKEKSGRYTYVDENGEIQPYKK
jgi:hypothetical protein